jgi:hypothetical protein
VEGKVKKIGVLEWWSNGVMGLQNPQSNTPILQYSIAPGFYLL